MSRPIRSLTPTVTLGAAQGFAISCGIPFIRAHIWSFGHTRRASAPTLMTIIPRDQWEVIEGCHEAIVTPEEWEQVQAIIDRKPPIMKGNACPFIICSTGWSTALPAGSPCRCGMKRSAEPGRTGSPARCGNRLTRRTISAQLYNRMGCKVCSSHKIEAREFIRSGAERAFRSWRRRP